MTHPSRLARSSALAAALAFGGPFACNKADFKSSNDKESTPESADLHCGSDGVYTDDDLNLEIKNDAKAKMVLQGEFCPQAPAELDLVFLVDFSLSMYNAAESRGNDQVVDKTCGRLKAATAIIDRHVKNVADQKAKIKVGIIQFASNLIKSIPLTDIKDLDAERTSDNFCGGVDGTNYKAAFEGATAMLKDDKATKVIYLISDGLPTEGGGGARGNFQRHLDAADLAADAMRGAVANLTFNTIFLGDPASDDLKELKPKDFLVKLTGSEERVKIAANADDLTSEILALEAPPVDLDTKSAVATLSAEGIGDTPVAFEAFAQANDKDQVWTFRTAEFKAFPGKNKASALSVSALDKTGQKYELNFNIAPQKGD